MYKKILTAIAAVMIINTCSVLAYDYPQDFWDKNDKYLEALERNDYHGTVKYGEDVIRYIEDAPDSKDKRDNLIYSFNKVGIAHAELEDYRKSAYYFERLYDYASQFGEQYEDYLRSATERINQYTPVIKMYTDGGTSPDYGAVNEPGNGVLFGICSNGDTRKQLGNESMILTYQELGEDLLPYNIGIMKEAKKSGCAVEFALNCPGQSADIRNIKKKKGYLEEISELFDDYSSVPVYLRFAAEFNVWADAPDPDDFISAFRYVSDYFKARNDNVAIVWSPNQVSGWYTNMDDFYPGDSYVDWVGVSLYAQKVFFSDPGNKESEIMFHTGICSDPVISIKRFVEKYGDRKPIMISEYGCGHKLMKSGTDTSDFAVERLREYLSYLPMVYPQIKLMAYFDWYVESSNEKNDFRLSSNKKLQNEFLKLTKGERFIQDGYNNGTGKCYRPVFDGVDVDSVFYVACYSHMYDSGVTGVTYYIDDKYVGGSKEIPYSTHIDASGYMGRHTLKAVAAFDNGQKLETESVIYINTSNRDITVEISDDEISFDQEPIIYKDRTMVPMRKIFEELGADVNWDSSTQTATGRKGDRTVRVTVGSNKMYVNSKEISLDIPPMIMNNRTLVPVRAVAEGLGCEVDWDSKRYIVSITPKTFRWSDWDDDLPSFVNEDLYYIEERTEYKYREKEYFEDDDERKNAVNYVRTDYEYGDWSDWQNDYIRESDTLEVETRTKSSPEKYLFAHWCTGWLEDESKKYRTSSGEWCDEAIYHELGWFDYKIPYSEDSDSDYTYYVDGEKYRCSNSCFRWYIVDREGGDYTQYRSRRIYKICTYWQWSDWSDYDTEAPTDYYDWDEIDVDERTVYRYKEK